MVLVKNHTAVITGNISSPSARTDTVKEISDRVSEFYTIVADKADINELEAQTARINELVAENAVIKGKVSASEADISELQADNVTINEKLTANEADIKKLQTDKIDAAVVEADYATIKSLEATDAKINNLSSTFGDFEVLTTDQFAANKASIDDLETRKLNASDAEIKYANIDFSNIGKAAIEYFYSTSGLIKNVIVGNQTITGELVGVTIKGDLIEGNTIVADKLVVKGTDGLYYKLNTDGITTEAEQTDYNSLNGSVIRANSITAEKIAVSDLVAFDATIAGFKITDSSLYSGVKNSATNATRGIYLGKDGQIAFGDGNNYIKYYKDTDGAFKLAISAESMTFSTGTSVKDAIDAVENKVESLKSVYTTIVEYQVGISGTTAPTGNWSLGIPTVPIGQYLWTRTTITYNDSTTTVLYSVSSMGEKGEKGDTGPQGPTGLQGIQGEKGEQGIQGPKGDTGAKGEKGEQGVQGPKGDTGAKGEKGDKGDTGLTTYFHIKYSSVANPTSSSQMTETPSEYIGTYVDFTQADSTDPSKYTWSRFQGLQGPQGTQGIPGTNGSNGKTSYLHIKYSNDGGSTFTENSGETVGTYIGTCVDYNSADPTTVSSYTWAKIKGETGAQGPQGATGPQGKSIGSVANYYLASSSSSGVTVSTSGWTTTVQSVSASKKYLWNYEVVKYTDGTTASTTSPCIIGAYGDTGSTGAQGPQGATGATGPQGPQGPKGEKGDQGPRGLQGIQGEKGDRGIQGPKGDNGRNSYFHIKYSSVANPTSSSQITETPSTYIGTYTDDIETDSTDPKKYTWQRLEGAKGDQGIPGNNGINGKTSYLHIAYANSSDGGTGFDVSNATGKLYIGQYTDFVEADSTDPKKYSWTKIKGDTGAKGDRGDTGATGNGISSIAEKYAVSSSNSTAPSTWYDTVQTMTATNKYLWNYEIITYTNGSKKETSKRVIGVYGDKGNTGATGPQGPQGATGATGAAGADAISLSITSSNGTVFKNNSGSTVLTAHVYVGGVEQSITDAGVCGSLGSIKWYKGASTTAVATSKTLTVSASDVTNSVAYTCQLEG